MTERLTKYQVEFLEEIRRGSPEDEGPVDFDQLLDRLSWHPTKASAHFSIRALIRRSLIRKSEGLLLRRGRKRVCFEMTPGGLQAMQENDTPEVGSGTPANAAEGLVPGVSEAGLTDFEVPEDPFRGSFEVLET